ncbi:MAG: HAMP domain-containing protein [Rhodospirillales bacterium]|nr:HAMP domain-containing protein [Rhodospirillales bacterium]MBO6785373.1 HAMP domain-containing protein [Rhodospirillales bacterium]
MTETAHQSLSQSIKRYLPKSLLGRSLLIIVMPLVLLQIISAIIFFESHWDKVTLRLAKSVAGDTSMIVSLMRRYPGPENHPWIFKLAAQHMEFRASYEEGEILPNRAPRPDGLLEEMLAASLQSFVNKPFLIDTTSLDDDVIIKVQLADGVLRIETTRKRLFSSTTYVFVIWMVGTSLILFAVAMIFMRNQVKPIRRLAVAADDFGKGRTIDTFKLEGATEVRQAASAFLAMRDRIRRQIAQRTDMLSGVSHDLRTPLTRMKLQLEMSGSGEDAAALKDDIAEMERMLEGYLAFARGEGGETPEPTDLSALLQDVAEQARRKNARIDLHTEGRIDVTLRPNGFRRCITNLIENAMRYAEHISIRAGIRGDGVEIVIDDDGPGIPEEQRAEVFRPFYRLESSRNPGTGGVGLGLSIARDAIQGHGGEIRLDESPMGGLRVWIRLPT